MKDIPCWLVLAFWLGWLIKLMWRQLVDVWELADLEQSATFEDWPAQGYWGDE